MLGGGKGGVLMKLCINCKHRLPETSGGPKFSRCALCVRAPEGIDPVAGEPISAEYGFCGVMRSDVCPCGPDGKLFEEKANV